jgi:hypothetical protein
LIQHRQETRRAFVVHLRAEPGVDGIRALRALLKAALRHYGLRAVDVRECALHAHQDERALAPTGRTHMSAFSDRIRSQQDKGLFKVADFEGGKERTLTISRLDEEMEMFGKTVDILNFVDTGRQLQLNQTNAEFLLDAFGDNPETWSSKRVTLYLYEYEFRDGKKQLGIRLKLPNAPAAAASGDGTGTVPARSRKADLDDEIPF